MFPVTGIIASALGCALCCTLVAQSAQRRGIKKATTQSCLQSMLICLTLGEVDLMPFAVKASQPNPYTLFSSCSLNKFWLSSVGRDHGLCSDCGNRVLGMYSRHIGATELSPMGNCAPPRHARYLPWTSIWTLAHMGSIWWDASSLSRASNL